MNEFTFPRNVFHLVAVGINVARIKIGSMGLRINSALTRVIHSQVPPGTWKSSSSKVKTMTLSVLQEGREGQARRVGLGGALLSWMWLDTGPASRA